MSKTSTRLGRAWRAICKLVPFRRLVCAYLLKWLQGRCEHPSRTHVAVNERGRTWSVLHCDYCGAAYYNHDKRTQWHRPHPTKYVDVV